jgi:hypothetical protein
MSADGTSLHGMLVRLELKRTCRDSDWHTTLARIRVDKGKASCRCLACNCHRLALSPELARFLLAVVAANPGAKNEVIISDGHYDPEDRAHDVEHEPAGDDLRGGGPGQDDVGVALP